MHQVTVAISGGGVCSPCATAEFQRMRPNLTSSCVSVAVASLLASSSPVLGQTPSLGVNRTLTVAPAIAVGNFTGHGYGDVAFIRDEKVVLATTPLMLESYDYVAQGLVARELATRRRGNTRNRDGLVIATPGGVYQWDPVGPMPRLDSRVFARLSTADLDGDGSDDLVGIDPAGSRVQVKAFAAQGQPTPIAQFLFSGEVVLGVATIDWNADGVREIAVATDQRLWVGDAYAGNSLFSYPVPNIKAELVEFRSRRQDLLAWVTRSTPNGPDTMYVVGQGVFEQTVVPGRGQMGTLAVGDVDANGYQDIAYTQDSMSAFGGVSLLYNQTGTPGATTTFSFATNKTQRVRLDPPLAPFGPASNRSRFWLGDLDGDGDSEVVMPNLADGRIAIADAPSGGAPVVPARAEIQGLSVNALFSTDPNRVGDVIGLNCVLALAHPLVPPPAANGVQLLLYGAVLRGGGELGAEFRTQPVVEVSDVEPFPAGAALPASVNFRLSVPDGWDFNTIGYYDRAFAGVLRYVRTDGNGDVAQAFAPRYLGIGINNLVYQLPAFPGNPELRTTPGGGAPTNGYVEPPRLPAKVSTAVVPVPVQ